MTNTKNEIVTKQTELDEIKDKKKLNLPKGRLFWNFLGLLNMVLKAKKITKKIKRDPNLYSEEYRYNWVKKKIRLVLKVANIRLHVFGIENWADRGIILAPNHQSNADPILMLAINDFSRQQPCAFIAKKEIWTIKIMKHFINLIDSIPLDRNSPRSAINAVKEAKELVNEYKRSLVVFPEGTRSASQELLEFKGASMKVAQMAYTPIVPVSIIDSYKLYEKRPKGRVDIKVVFGKPLMPEKFISIKTDTLTQNVKKEVQKNIDKYVGVDVNPKTTKLVPKRIDKKNRTWFY